MTLRCTPDPRLHATQPTVDQRVDHGPELRRRPPLTTSDEAATPLGGHPQSRDTAVPSPEVAMAGRW
jgi:hypothetical protein